MGAIRGSSAATGLEKGVDMRNSLISCHPEELAGNHFFKRFLEFHRGFQESIMRVIGGYWALAVEEMVDRCVFEEGCEQEAKSTFWSKKGRLRSVLFLSISTFNKIRILEVVHVVRRGKWEQFERRKERKRTINGQSFSRG